MSEPLKLYVAVREDGFYKTGYNTASGTIVKDALMCSYLGARDRLCTPNEVEKGKVVEVVVEERRAGEGRKGRAKVTPLLRENIGLCWSCWL